MRFPFVAITLYAIDNNNYLIKKVLLLGVLSEVRKFAIFTWLDLNKKETSSLHII